MIIDGLTLPVPERRWFKEWRAGVVAAVHATVAIWENATETFSLIGRWRRVLEENADIVELATSAGDIERVAASGRTAVVMGFQNTSPVEYNIELFRAFRDLGVRVMQLTYNLQNYIGSGYWEENDTGVSSRFGRKAIEEMNELGTLIDLSHCGERTTLDAIEHSARPVAITHSNPREFVGNPLFGAGRLKTTEAITLLASRGGVIGLSPNRHLTQAGRRYHPGGVLPHGGLDGGPGGRGHRGAGERLQPRSSDHAAHLVALRALVTRNGRDLAPAP